MSERAYEKFEVTIDTAIRNVGVFSYLVDALVKYPVKHSVGPYEELQTLATHPYKKGKQGYDVRRRILLRQVNPAIFPPILHNAANDESFSIPVAPNERGDITVNTPRLLRILMKMPDSGAEVTGWALHILADNRMPPSSDPVELELPKAA